MFRKKESEFQYAPGIEKMIEDVAGGGTIARAELKGKTDELPPLVLVGKDANGLYHVVKTAKVTAAVEAASLKIKVAKNHLFGTGEAVAAGGAFTGAAGTITAVDKSNAGYDELTLSAAIGAVAAAGVLVLAEKAAAAGAAAAKYAPEAVTMNKVDITVANQQSGLLVRGTVNESVMPYPVDAALKASLGYIRFINPVK